MKETMSKITQAAYMVLKLLIFFSLVWTAIVMFQLKSVNTGINVLLTGGIFLLFTKIDSMDRKIKELEMK